MLPNKMKNSVLVCLLFLIGISFVVNAMVWRSSYTTLKDECLFTKEQIQAMENYGKVTIVYTTRLLNFESKNRWYASFETPTNTKIVLATHTREESFCGAVGKLYHEVAKTFPVLEKK